MIIDTLNTQIIDAMKAKDALRVSTLKLLMSEIKNFQIDHPQMTEEEELAIVKKESKKRKDSIEAFEKAGRQELADKEKAELEILAVYLPTEMGDEELERIVTEVISGMGEVTMQQVGQVMGQVMARVKGQADGGRVSAVVRSKLS